MTAKLKKVVVVEAKGQEIELSIQEAKKLMSSLQIVLGFHDMRTADVMGSVESVPVGVEDIENRHIDAQDLKGDATIELKGGSL